MLHLNSLAASRRKRNSGEQSCRVSLIGSVGGAFVGTALHGRVMPENQIPITFVIRLRLKKRANTAVASRTRRLRKAISLNLVRLIQSPRDQHLWIVDRKRTAILDMRRAAMVRHRATGDVQYHMWISRIQILRNAFDRRNNTNIFRCLTTADDTDL